MMLFIVLYLVLQLLVGYNLFVPIVLYLLYLLKGKKPVVDSIHPVEPDYAIIVTAYEETALLPQVVNSLLQLDYSNYLVYIVADKCDVSNLHFDSEKVMVLRPETTLASNVKSHFYAINHFQRAHERLTIIDSDNLVKSNYLLELNKVFAPGFNAVQGVREAKNLQSTTACLDAARDKYYHLYDGEVLFSLGASATLAGSGMAFTTELYKTCLENNLVEGAGFDKVLQYEIVKRGQRIAFAADAIVYDEKTARPEQLVKQRARWINTWFRYFGFGFDLLGKGIRNFSRNQFLFGLILLRPPLFIFLLLSVVFAATDVFFVPAWALVWVVGLASFVAAFMLSLTTGNADKRIYAALKNIPVFMCYQLISLTKARKANKLSVATRHVP